MRMYILSFIVINFIFSCSSVNHKSILTTNKEKKVTLIHDLIEHVGFVRLPYKAIFNESTKGTYRIQCWGKDSLLCQDFIGTDSYVVGALPDTSKYYSFIFITVSAIEKPNLVTFAKNGNKISSYPLTEENSVIYVGDILECEEYAIIDGDLKIKSYFKSRVAYETTTVDVFDTICTHYETDGYINPEGKIIFGKRIEYKCK
jgi:hypothetical protein